MKKLFFIVPHKWEVASNLKTTKGPPGIAVMKYTQNILDKIEKVAEESGYVIRYERGNFQSGYCILQEKRVVVLNKFLQTEGRINTLIDLMPQLEIHIDSLTLESQKMYDEVMSMAHEK
ncbi:MAG: hypothetical protein ABI707_16775 [Ferruginibacter sp.]